MRIEATTPLQESSGSTATVFIRWPYNLHTFDRVLRRAHPNFSEPHKFNLIVYEHIALIC
jgi:hypothetical protein